MIMKVYKKIKKCRICNSTNLKNIINLNNQYIQGSFLKKNNPRPYLKKIPLKITIMFKLFISSTNAYNKQKYSL